MALGTPGNGDSRDSRPFELVVPAVGTSDHCKDALKPGAPSTGMPSDDGWTLGTDPAAALAAVDARRFGLSDGVDYTLDGRAPAGPRSRLNQTANQPTNQSATAAVVTSSAAVRGDVPPEVSLDAQDDPAEAIPLVARGSPSSEHAHGATRAQGGAALVPGHTPDASVVRAGDRRIVSAPSQVVLPRAFDGRGRVEVLPAGRWSIPVWLPRPVQLAIRDLNSAFSALEGARSRRASPEDRSELVRVLNHAHRELAYAINGSGHGRTIALYEDRRGVLAHGHPQVFLRAGAENESIPEMPFFMVAASDEPSADGSRLTLTTTDLIGDGTSTQWERTMADLFRLLSSPRGNDRHYAGVRFGVRYDIGLPAREGTPHFRLPIWFISASRLPPAHTRTAEDIQDLNKPKDYRVYFWAGSDQEAAAIFSTLTGFYNAQYGVNLQPTWRREALGQTGVTNGVFSLEVQNVALLMSHQNDSLTPVLAARTSARPRLFMLSFEDTRAGQNGRNVDPRYSGGVAFRFYQSLLEQNRFLRPAQE